MTLPGSSLFDRLRSDLPENGFPAISSGDAALLWSIQFQLSRSQWWSLETIREQQASQLQQLLEHASQHCDHYKDLQLLPGAPLGEQLAALPILTRSQLREQLQAICSKALPKSHGEPQQSGTSGSTGSPVHFFSTGLTRLMWQSITLREHLWQRRDFSHKLAAIRAAPAEVANYPEGSHSQGWGVSTDQVVETGPSALLNVSTPIPRQAEWLQRQRPGYLLSHPANLAELARYCRENQVNLPGLLQVRAVGESVNTSLRALCRETWACELVDLYSCKEAGYLALQCPDHPEHYHVQSETVILEVLDSDDSPCEAGDVGRVVITSLHNFASPLIRYELGDMAEVGPPCPCGRGLPTLKRILGRYRQLLKLPEGGWLYLTPNSWGMEQLPGLRHFQLRQVGERNLELLLACNQPFDKELVKALADRILKPIPSRMELKIRYVGQIPLSIGGKREEFVCLIS